MRRIKSKFLAVLSLTLFISNLASVPLYAQENVEKDNDYQITYEAEEITDTEALINLALLQQKSRAKTEQNINISGSDFIANQLLEVREYPNGEIEKSYASTGIVLSSERASILLPEQESHSSSRIPSFDVTAKFYYTTKGVTTDNLVYTYTYRVDKVETVITKKEYSAIDVTSGTQSYICAPGAIKRENFNYRNSNLIGQQTFTLNSSHSGFYSSNNDALTALSYGVAAESYSTYSNGGYVLLQFYAYR